MSQGAIFTSLIAFIISIGALVAGVSIFRQRKFVNKSFMPYAFFLFSTAFLWFFAALSLLSLWLGDKSLGRFFYLIDQLFVFLSGPFLSWYFVLRANINKNFGRIIIAAFFILAIAGTFFLVSGGATEGEVTYFDLKYKPNNAAFLTFLFTLAALFLASVFDTIFGIFKRQKSLDFIFSSAVAAYLLIGAFDESGFIAGWKLVLFRLSYAAIFLFVFIFFRHRFLDDENLFAENRFPATKLPPGHYFLERRTIFRKFLVILILLSLLPVGFSSFLTISSYQGALYDIQEGVNFNYSELRQNILIQILLILFLLVILVSFASVLVARGITQPLSNFVQGVNEVARGNLNIQFKVKSKDELGQLASAFNEMIAKLKEQREREQVVARLKTEFISIAAHQLRTPLSTIKWILRMLVDGDFGPLTAQQKSFADKGYEANDRMIHLVNDLLDITRIEEGRFGFEFGWHDFKKFMEDIADSLSGDAKVRDIKLSVSFPEENLILFFDPEKLRMAVSNLISNAIRYTKPGGSVSVSFIRKEKFVETAVRDTGVGIPQHQKDRIFTKFFRGDNVVRMQTEGTGLGLYLAKNIVEKHGGKAWFESEENKGSTFYFTIPIGAEKFRVEEEEQKLA